MAKNNIFKTTKNIEESITREETTNQKVENEKEKENMIIKNNLESDGNKYRFESTKRINRKQKRKSFQKISKLCKYKY